VSEPGPSRVRLRIAARGYDRDEVDAQLVENDRSAEEVQARLQDIEAELTEADHRAKALEAKVAELEQRGGNGPPESVQWLHDVTDQILRVTSEDAHELMIKMENEAKAEKLAAERIVAETMAAAQARATQITEAARRHNDDASHLQLESHRQVDLYVDQSKATAEERAGAVWNEAQSRIQEVRLERDRVEEERRSLLEELSHVRGSVENLEHYLGRERVSDAQSPIAVVEPWRDA
jgi:predicted nuclease with TOPRIM domain